jgi:DNA-binding PadR family transcriptional regulator
LAADADENHDLLSGLIRLHILHHAVDEGIYGQWMIEELGRHGYRISPGTLYPMLHAMERKGYLKSSLLGSGRRARRLYRATAKGRRSLASAKDRVRELFGELIEGR